MKCASARLWKGDVFIQAFAQTTTGLWISNGPVYVAKKDDLPAKIGVKILAAFENSVVGLAHPAQEKWKAIQAPMLEAAGVKTWAALEKGAKSVGLEDRGELVSFMPTVKDIDGPRDLPDHLVLSRKIEDELGLAMLKAFDACD